MSDIRTVLGSQVTDGSAGPIEQKLSERYDRYFTRQGKIKTGKNAPPIVRLNDSLESARKRRGEALELLQHCETVSRRVEELGARHRQLKLEAGELSKTLQAHRFRAEEYRSLKAQFSKRLGDLDKNEAQLGRLRQHLELIRSGERELEEKKAELARLETEIPLKRREVEQREKEAAAAKSALETARKNGEAVAEAEALADMARRFVELSRRREESGQRLQKIEAVEGTLEVLKKERAGLAAPDRKTLKTIVEAVQERDKARLLMDAAMISLEIVPASDGRLEVYSGQYEGSLTLTPGKAVLVKGSPEVVAELKGVARLRASGPAGDMESLRASLHKREDQIEERSRPFGTADPARLEELTENAEKLDRRIGEALKEEQTLLGGETAEGLLQGIARLEAELEGILKEHPGWTGSLPDSQRLRLAAADAKQQHAQGVSDAEALWDKAQSAFSSADQQEKFLSSLLDETRKALRKTEARIGELTSDGKTVAEREEEIRKHLLEYDAAKVALKDLQEKLEGFADDPEAALEKLEQNLAGLQDSARQTRDQERKSAGELEILTARGAYSMLALAEEEIARIEAEIQRESLGMDAVKLLFDTVQQCRSEAVASVARPVQEAATRLLHRITGRRIGGIEIGENFAPSGIRPETVESPIDPVNLSGGEREQLYLATRLALAEVLAGTERQMVVLDDVLTATDTGRLARVMTILEESAEQLQLLVLTCHPERYRALSGARFFDLEALAENAGGAQD